MKKNKLNNLFVYGTLRSGFKNPAYDYISRYFTLTGAAKVKGKLYDMGEYPVAVTAADESFIFGEVYCINNETEFEWAIEQIDDYEGLNVMPGEKPLYRRDKCIAHLDEAADAECWIYWYNGEVTGKPALESGDVLDYFSAKK